MVAPLYLDASVLTAMALRDDGFVAMAGIIATAPELPINSDLGWGEFIAAVGARTRSRSFEISVASRLVEQARVDLLNEPLELVTTSDIAAGTGYVGAFDLPLKLPDAIHIAIARRLGATLVSNDRQQVAAARALGIDCINPIEDAP